MTGINGVNYKWQGFIHIFTYAIANISQTWSAKWCYRKHDSRAMVERIPLLHECTHVDRYSSSKGFGKKVIDTCGIILWALIIYIRKIKPNISQIPLSDLGLHLLSFESFQRKLSHKSAGWDYSISLKFNSHYVSQCCRDTYWLSERFKGSSISNSQSNELRDNIKSIFLHRTANKNWYNAHLHTLSIGNCDISSYSGP